jgi:hypothetical protein
MVTAVTPVAGGLTAAHDGFGARARVTMFAFQIAIRVRDRCYLLNRSLLAPTSAPVNFLADVGTCSPSALAEGSLLIERPLFFTRRRPWTSSGFDVLEARLAKLLLHTD